MTKYEPLLQHNKKTFYEVEHFIAKKQNCCVVNPCGSGKTDVMSSIIKNHQEKKFVILTKQKNAKNYYRNLDPIFRKITVKTYSKMLSDYKNKTLNDYNCDFLLADEAHSIGAEKWSEAFRYIKTQFNPIVIGFTATPQRFEEQGTDESIVNSYFEGHSAGNYSTKELQKEGVFKEPEYILSIYDMNTQIANYIDKVECAKIPDKTKERYIEQLEHTLDEWEKTSKPELVLKEALPRYMYKEHSNRILIYMPSVADIKARQNNITEMIQNVFPDKKIKSYRYTHLDQENKLQQFLSEDQNYIKILFSVDKIMETVHIDDLCIAIMLRPSISNRIITQQFGRINSIGNKNKPLIIDMVDNLSNLGKTNFLGGTGIAGTGLKQKQHNELNLIHVSKYRGIFDAIDALHIRSPKYTYKGFNGSLSEICKINNKPYSEVRKLIDMGYDIEIAMNMVHEQKPRISQEIFDDYLEFKEFTLTDEQKQKIIKYIPLVESFICRKNIKNDDIKQELFIECMYRLSSITDFNKTGINSYLINSLNTKYTLICRYKTIRKDIFCEQGLHELNISSDDNTYKEAEFSMIRKNISEVVSTLTDREQKVLELRFKEDLTLERTARCLGVTRERIRQIEAKALRKLRQPCRSKKLKGII